MWTSSIRPGLEVERLSEQDRLHARAEWNILRYTNDDLNAFEHYYNLDWNHIGEKYRFDFAGAYSIQTTLTSELEESGILAQLNRHQWLASPSFSYQLTPRQNITISYRFQDLDYDKKNNIRVFTDYRYHTLSGDWRYRWNAKTDLSVTAFASRYNPVDFASHTDTFGGQAGISYRFSETLQGSFLGGIRYTLAESNFRVARIALDPSGNPIIVFDRKKQESSDVGFIFSANLTKTFQRGHLGLDFSQQLTPLAIGGQVQQLRASIKMDYEPWERWRALLRLTALRNEALSSTLSGRSDRTYFSVHPELRWRWTREIILGIAYTFRYQKFKSIDRPAESNEFLVNLIYQPLRVP